MIIKHIKTGGTARTAKNYLEQKLDYKGEERNQIEVMRGNPESTTELADSLDFKHKYSSAVIAWHKDDNPSKEQMNEVLDEYEKLAFAGLNNDQYSYYAIRHDEHIHIITARVELEHGKSFNVAPPNSHKHFGLIDEKMNMKYDWKSPREHTNQLNIDNLHNAKNKEAKEFLHGHITEQIERGKVNDRQDLIRELEKFGEITRQGKDYVSLKLKDAEKAIRLKGEIYGQEFRNIKGRDTEARGPTDRERQDRGAKAREELERVIHSRAEYNEQRYNKDQVKTLVNTNDNRNVNRDGLDYGNFESRELSREKDNRAKHNSINTGHKDQGTSHEEKQIGRDTQEDKEAISNRDNKRFTDNNNEQGNRERHNTSFKHSESKEVKKRTNTDRKEEVDYDRIRRIAKRSTNEPNHNIQKRNERVTSDSRRADENSRNAKSLIKRVGEKYRDMAKEFRERVGKFTTAVKKYGNKIIKNKDNEGNKENEETKTIENKSKKAEIQKLQDMKKEQNFKKAIAEKLKEKEQKRAKERERSYRQR
jgi:hypothetical protein